MVSSSTVSSDANVISSSLKKYQSLMQETTANGVWEGISRNNALSKSEEVVSAYASTIDSQMCSLSSALDLLIEYKELKEQYKSVETTYQSAIAKDDPSAETYLTKMREIDAKMKVLRIKIESLLANIISSSIETPISNFANTSALLGLTSGEKSIESGIPSSNSNYRGEFVNYYQGNYNDSYGYGTTIAKAGCGPTSMAMVLTCLKDEEITPPETASWSLENGYRVEGSGTSWAYFDAISNTYGINCTETSVSKSNIKNSLEKGELIIMSMGPGTFTKGGHFIVLTGLTDDGKIKVADPASESRSSQTYDYNVFINEGKEMWSFSE